MSNRAKPEIVREQAIRIHEENVQFFVKQYRRFAEDSYATAFIYGRKKMEELLDRLVLETPKGGRILDIGCGTGEQLKRLRKFGYQVAGIEPAPGMLALARKNNPDTRVESGVATKLPFEDASFDFVLAIEVLRYLHKKDVEQAYREMLRVTKPGGRIFFSMVNRYALDAYYPWHQARAFLLKVLGKPDKAHCEFTTPAKIKADFARLGVRNVVCYGRMLAPLRLVYRLSPKLGRLASRALEPLDDVLAKTSWATPLAGHLLVVVQRNP